jgi:FkbM family methyltransferase
MAIISKLRTIKNKLINPYVTNSFSQEGEDMILKRIFDGRTQGLYVDVGAHDPIRFSNTYYFYKLGWQGINIEPNPNGIASFNSVRKRDINLQLGIAEESGTLTYHWFSDPALNTFNSELAHSRIVNTSYKLLYTSEIQVERLDLTLSKHLAPNTEIDFLTIDVEGLDFSVLRSNDWQRYRPKYVLVEALETTLEGVINGELHQYMKQKDYELFAKTVNTLFFVNRKISA